MFHKKRFKMRPHHSKKSFTHHARKVHKKNMLNPMRGGIRA